MQSSPSDRPEFAPRDADWDEEYAKSSDEAKAFSWYSGWSDLAPFWEELVPHEATVLLPGIGNDAAMVDLYDAGWRKLFAFDYAAEGVERSRELFGDGRPIDLRVADARELPYADDAFDAVLDKGTFDAIFLAGGDSLARAVAEVARTVRPGGLVVSFTGFLDKVSAAFADERAWRCVRDGSVHVTESGYASNSVNAHLLAWERVEEPGRD